METRKKLSKKKKVVVKKKKVIKKKKVVNVPDELYRVDMEVVLRNAQKEFMGYSYIPHFPGRNGTADEQMARSIMDSLKRIGVGGKLIHVDGTPDGSIVEQWPSLGRLLDAKMIEEKRIENESEKKMVM